MADPIQTDTPNLALPLLAAAQAQKHVTHNEALLAIDALLHLSVLDRDRGTPPAGPADGDRYIVGPGATGAWLGQEGALAIREAGAWRLLPPRAGFLAYVADERLLLCHDGRAWAGLPAGALATAARLGIGTEPDAANPFAAKLNGALWTARTTGEGGTGDLRSVLNKQGPASVLSLLFQSGYSGRAEFGLVGDDDVQLKVSPDGAAWTEALRVKADGRVGIGTASPADRLSVSGAIAPAADNAWSLGTAQRRVSAVYAATGTITTSDLRAKREVTPLDPDLALTLLRATAPIGFRWAEGGLEEGPGPDGTPVLRARPGRRRHFGWSAQAWRDALAASGEDSGLLVRLGPDDPASELALRPDQITAVLHAAVLALADRLERATADGG